MSMILSVMLATMAVGDTPAAVKEEKKAEMDQVVCKRFPPPVGSRLGARKVCATKREWAIQKQEQSDALDEVQSRSTLTSN